MAVPELLTPPLRFNTVQPNLYRGSYPREINYKFLLTLELKTIISLTPQPITLQNDPKLYNFAQLHNIKLVHIECAKSGKGKKRGVSIDYPSVVNCIEIILNRTNNPIYLHCLNGSQVTSLVVACIRKLTFWSSISIFNEFISFSSTITINDRNFVEEFNGIVNIPKDSEKVNWIWMGLSKGVVDNHPTIRVNEV